MKMYNYCMFTFNHSINKSFKFKCFTNLIIFILKNFIIDITIGHTILIRVFNYSNKNNNIILLSRTLMSNTIG